MKKPIMISFLFLFFTVSMAQADKSFRCGNDLLSIGDLSFRVLNTCGEPVFKEETGYTIKNNKRELKIEVWVYGPRAGRYYYLTFEGGKLVEIKDVKQ